MLDLQFLRNNKEKVTESIKKRRLSVDFDQFISTDEARRKLIVEVETLNSEKNKAAKAKAIEKGKEIKEKLQKKEAELAEIEVRFQELLEQIPNLLHPEVPDGTSEKDNQEIKKWGDETKFDFVPKDHLTLGKELGIIDQERGAKLSGHGFYYLTGDGARLELALVSWVVDFLTKGGFTPLIPPLMVRKRFVEGTGYLPRRQEPDIYKIDGEDLFLSATAEIQIAGMHADEMLDTLPKNYVGFSPSFRKEAGSYGKYTHGIFRVHQFDKVEIFKFVVPEKSEEAFKEIISLQEKIYQDLEIPYQVVNICSGEMSAPAFLKYDLEYWDPVEGRYREMTSTSNTTDYQARRLNIKYKSSGKAEFVHTLNGTAIALSRTIIALLENHQQKDGSVRIPKALHEYLGKDIIQRQE